MGVVWSDLSQDMKKCILLCFRKECENNITVFGMSSSIISFQKMNLNYFVDFSKEDIIAFDAAFNKFVDKMSKVDREYWINRYILSNLIN